MWSGPQKMEYGKFHVIREIGRTFDGEPVLSLGADVEDSSHDA